jgi:hypothetical protein
MARITLTTRTASQVQAHQGVARDATRFWTTSGADNFTLYEWAVDGSGLPDTAGPTDSRDCELDFPGTISQINGIYYHSVDGMLYVTGMDFTGDKDGWVNVYDPDDLAGGPVSSHQLRTAALEGVTWNATRGTWWAFYHESIDVDEYDTSWNLIDTKTPDLAVGGTPSTEKWNGGFWYNDLLYLNPHNQNADDRIYIYKLVSDELVFVNHVAQPAAGCGQGMFLFDSTTLYMAERLTTTTGNVMKCAFVAEPAPTSLLSALVEWWELNEASGNALGSHAGKTLTETSGTIDAATGPGGAGGSRDLEAGDTEYFARSDSGLSMSGHQALSLIAFINLESTPAGNAGVAGKWNSSITQAGYLLFVTTNPTITWAVSPDGTSTAANAKQAQHVSTLSAGTWYMVYGDHDPVFDEIRAGVNDPQTDTFRVTTTGVTGGVFNSSADFIVGAHNAGGSASLDAKVSKIGLFNRVVTDGEYRWLHNSGNGRTYAEIVAAASPLPVFNNHYRQQGIQ